MNGLAVNAHAPKGAHIIQIEMDLALLKVVEPVKALRMAQELECLMMYSALMADKNQR